MRERRDLIQKHGRRKLLTLGLVVPCVQKRDADGNPTWKEGRITAGNLMARGEVPGTYSLNLAGRALRYMAQLELQMEGDLTTHKDLGGAYFHGRKTPIEPPGGRAIFDRTPPGWAGFKTQIETSIF